MTQYFNDRKFSLTSAPLHVRVLLSAFSVVVFIALAVGVINYWDKTGMTPAGVVAWYKGNEGINSPGQPMMFEKTFRELLDAVHPHLFGQGVLLFILSHIVALTALSQRAKIAIYVVSFGAMLLDAGVPWLIRYASPGFAPLQLVSVGLLTGSFLAQILFPFREMWFVPRTADALEDPIPLRPDRSRFRERPRPPRRPEPARGTGDGARPKPEPVAASRGEEPSSPKEGRRRRSRWRRGRHGRGGPRQDRERVSSGAAEGIPARNATPSSRPDS